MCISSKSVPPFTKFNKLDHEDLQAISKFGTLSWPSRLVLHIKTTNTSSAKYDFFMNINLAAKGNGLIFKISLCDNDKA